MSLLSRIERYLKRNKTSPTNFGRAALGDPRFVFDLRDGRRPEDPTIARAHAWLDHHEDAATALRRTVRVGLEGFGGNVAVERIVSRRWASLDGRGHRQMLRLRLRGEGAGAAADAFVDGLLDREFELKGHIVADIRLLSDERDSNGTFVRLGLEVLTVEAD